MVSHAVAEYAESGRVWHFGQAGADSDESWNPEPLIYACDTIARDRRKRMTRIRLVFAYPRIPDGVGEVVEYAESLARDYGLHVECAAKGGIITVTFERTVPSR